MNTLRQTIALPLVAISVLCAASATAAPSGTACGSVNPVQRRIVEHANLGMSELRSYVRMTGMIHGISMVEVRESLDTWRAALNCQNEAAVAKAAEERAGTQEVAQPETVRSASR